MSKKLIKIERTIDELLHQWFLETFKNIVGNSKLTIKTRKSKDSIIKTTYYAWSEDFIDEDTGEVVNVERITLVMIEKNGTIKLFNHRGYEIKPPYKKQK